MYTTYVYRHHFQAAEPKEITNEQILEQIKYFGPNCRNKCSKEVNKEISRRVTWTRDNCPSSKSVLYYCIDLASKLNYTLANFPELNENKVKAWHYNERQLEKDCVPYHKKCTPTAKSYTKYLNTDRRLSGEEVVLGLFLSVPQGKISGNTAKRQVESFGDYLKNYFIGLNEVKITRNLGRTSAYKKTFPKQVTAFGEKLSNISWSLNPID